MASERQIATNRRNARKSTGPRSGAGKNRSSRNAYRHGLTLSITSTAAFAKQLDKLVREIAGDTSDAIMLERARAIAQSELDLARVRRAKVALIERASAFGELDPPRVSYISSVTRTIRFLNALDRGRFILPKPSDSSATMPSQEPDQSAEAVRRVLPELRKLDRYIKRNFFGKMKKPQSMVVLLQNEANLSQSLQWLAKGHVSLRTRAGDGAAAGRQA
jgi:hypothetical protein